MQCRSCAALVAASSEHVIIDAAGVAAAAAALAPAAVRAAAPRVRLPIRFDSLVDELDYLSVSSLLDFGSGFDPLLRASGQREAAEAVEFGLLGAAMQGAPLDAAALAGMTRAQVGSLLGITATEEREVMPGVTLTSPMAGPLAPLLGLAAAALNGTGAALRRQGQASLGAYVLALVQGRAAAGLPPSAGCLVEDLAESFAAFDDRAPAAADGGGADGGGSGAGSPAGGPPVRAVWHRKAQGLAVRLYARFGAEDARFAFADADALSADSGEALTAALAACEPPVLRLSAALRAVIAAGEDLGGGDARAAALRAGAVEAARRVCAAAGAQFSPYQLSAFLLRRARGDAAGWAALPRHVARGTMAY